MNVLEKILEEVDKRKQKYEDELILEVSQKNIDEIRNRVSELKDVENIIRSHMGEAKDTNVSGKWIPVSERLPEEYESIFAKFKGTDKWSNAMFEKKSDEVNVTVEFEDGTRKTGTSYTLDGRWRCEKENRFVKQKVVAWQPLLESYKGE